MQNQPDYSELKKLLNAGIIAMFAICVVLLILGVFGASKVKLDIPSNATVYINNHPYKGGADLSLHPGKYELSIAAPAYKTDVQTVSFKTFASRTITESDFIKRQPVNILSSVIGAYGLYGRPSFTAVKWFDDDVWLVGEVGPSTAAPIVLHYVKNSWNVAYFNQSGYDSDSSILPNDVAAYLATLSEGSNE